MQSTGIIGALIALSNDKDPGPTVPMILKIAGIFLGKITLKTLSIPPN